MSLLHTPLSEIACKIPGSTAVFHRYRLDFCCGGQQVLGEALAKKNLDEEEVLSALESLQLGAQVNHTDWSEVEDSALIDHILTRFHAVHREQMPELIRLAQRVEAVHGDKPDCPVGLADHLTAVHQAMLSHMQKEEAILFPMLQNGQYQMSGGPIGVMRQEHDSHGADLARIDMLTNNITPPENACNTWQALYSALATFKADLMEHIHLENNVLFARAQKGA
ncbi:iron-sulfur cluster repair protein YtfE [Teredinibacter sp. KSP-S5-2]|uniref:iron-sulfur cluster repair protein YtfE n=1 Tax=Teredinibacter sp. KSP-S5-2 TaxID=3034506 RepID=UPI0029349303|nr:iron-sulfur cluster repair protein YtfE [Teredinibacter sp. KSP-S5-2]WNO10759.1 iron-sulfur cluster repair protein YtfE [Teredinibacter sp. KSP-S5-2]